MVGIAAGILGEGGENLMRVRLEFILKTIFHPQ